MKYHLRVPTEMYAYIEAEYEGDTDGAISAYRELTEKVKVQPEGLPKKQYDEIIDLMIKKEPIMMDPGELEKMNRDQRIGFDVVRKSLGRINYENR